MNRLLEMLHSEIMIPNSLTTPTVREISARFYKELPNHSYDAVITLCEILLEESHWAYRLIAFDWAYRQRSNYTLATWTIFEKWLYKYVRDWGDCDDFCTHAFGTLMVMYPCLHTRVVPWTSSEFFAVRRAAYVIFVLPIRRDIYNQEFLFHLVKLLMQDDHYLVLKGYGWMLKVLSQKNQHAVIDFLTLYKDNMPRVAYRYALEKMPETVKYRLMK